MALVAYPDSDSDPSPDDHVRGSPSPTPSHRPGSPSHVSSLLVGRKRKRSRGGAASLPPLPATFHDLYATNTRASTTDDPSLHGGRKRAVAHVEGNWPSHVYLEWIPIQDSEQLLEVVATVQEALHAANKTRTKPLPVPDIIPSLRSPLGALLPLHISLTRTLQIKTADREAFLETLTTSLRKASVRPFQICFTNLRWVPNYDRTRWFLVLGIKKPAQDELNMLLATCNRAVERCGHSGLYVGGRGDGPMNQQTASPQNQHSNANMSNRLDRTENFHISIAWNLLEPVPEWIELAGQVDLGAILQPSKVSFSSVKAKIGNVVHSIDLAPQTREMGKGSGLLGLG